MIAMARATGLYTTCYVRTPEEAAKWRKRAWT